MKKNTKAQKRLLDARQKADAILAIGSNRLLLIEAILILCVFVSLFISLQSATALLLSILPQDGVLTSLLSFLPTLACIALIIWFAAPVTLGLFRLAEQMQAGEAPVLLDLFYFLSSRERYQRGLYFTRFASLKVSLMILLVDTVSILCPTPWLCGLLIALVILLCIVWMLFPYKRFYFYLKDKAEPQDVRGGLRFVGFFIPWILMGIVSIGLLLVLDVIPRMLLTYFCDCDRTKNAH